MESHARIATSSFCLHHNQKKKTLNMMISMQENLIVLNCEEQLF